MIEKERPVLILSVPYGDRDRAVITVVFHTTAVRGSAFEVSIPCAFLKPGAFVCQSVATYPVTRAIRRLGLLHPAQLQEVEKMVFKWLGR
jgi:mRNA interferase MazF